MENDLFFVLNDIVFDVLEENDVNGKILRAFKEYIDTNDVKSEVFFDTLAELMEDGPFMEGVIDQILADDEEILPSW